MSYGGTWQASVATQVGLVPVGYADGVPRAAGNRAGVTIAGHRCALVGRVAMDQCVVDLGPASDARPGDEVVVFGDEPTADLWGEWSDSIGYEIVTRIGDRVPRVHLPRGHAPRGDVSQAHLSRENGRHGT